MIWVYSPLTHSVECFLQLEHCDVDTGKMHFTSSVRRERYGIVRIRIFTIRNNNNPIKNANNIDEFHVDEIVTQMHMPLMPMPLIII